MRGSDAARFAVMMRVHVDETRNDRFAFGIDDTIDTCGGAVADASNASSFCDDRARFDDFSILQGDDARVRQRDGTLRDDARHAEMNFGGVSFCTIGMVEKIFIGIAVFDGCTVAPARIHSAIKARWLNCEDWCLAIERNRPLDHSR